MTDATIGIPRGVSRGIVLDEAYAATTAIVGNIYTQDFDASRGPTYYVLATTDGTALIEMEMLASSAGGGWVTLVAAQPVTAGILLPIEIDPPARRTRLTFTPASQPGTISVDVQSGGR